MNFEFMSDLDAYFSEKYANYDHICILKGYVMPQMHATKRREDGTDYAYTLPASTMRLSQQKEKEALLAQLKEKMVDISFSFSFTPVSLWRRIGNLFRKDSFYKILPEVLAKYNLKSEDVLPRLDIDEKIWKGICKGKYMPTKNLIFSMVLVCHMSMDDTLYLMENCGFDLDYTQVKDTVISYLISEKIFNEDMVRAAFTDYKIENLFIKCLN